MLLSTQERPLIALLLFDIVSHIMVANDSFLFYYIR